MATGSQRGWRGAASAGARGDPWVVRLGLPEGVEMRRVDYFFVGPGKCGTSWLYEFCARHQLVNTPSLKEPYLLQFSEARQQEYIARLYTGTGPIADFSNTYSFNKTCPRDIQQHNARARVVITVRKPSDRVRSHFRYHERTAATGLAMREYFEAGDTESMLERSDYRPMIERFVTTLGRERILVLPLEVLRREPDSYASRLCDFLGAETVVLDERDLEPVRVASEPRWPVLGRSAKRLAVWLRGNGHLQVLGALKRSSIIERSLFRASPPSRVDRMDDFGPATARLKELDESYPDVIREFAGWADAGV